MVFSSITFLLYFLPVTLILYFAVPSVKGRNLVLLMASLFFYAWGEPVYVILMVISILGNYLMVRLMDEAQEDLKHRKVHLAFLILWNLTGLFFFKYADFLVDIINRMAGTELKKLELSLPIGISFYTFQALSYVIDVYRRKTACQKNLISFALYITMFPQLIAGPIVKYNEIAERLQERRITRAAFGQGVERFIFGLSKKVLLANTLGQVFTLIFQQPASERTFLLVWLGAFSYTFQIYFDFSGYSDMAIGLGYMLGFRFPENFRHPYLASSVTEFWRRWHISLSSWFRDYVYIPLGGNRVSKSRHILNLIIVWGLTGLWHGASLNFLLWGFYYAFWLIIEKYLLEGFEEKHRVFSHLLTALIVIFGWMLFSFTDFTALKTYVGQMLGFKTAGFLGKEAMYLLKSNIITLIIACLASGSFLYGLYRRVREKWTPAALVIQIMLLVIAVSFLVYQSYNPFLYFRF